MLVKRLRSCSARAAGSDSTRRRRTSSWPHSVPDRGFQGIPKPSIARNSRRIRVAVPFGPKEGVGRAQGPDVPAEQANGEIDRAHRGPTDVEPDVAGQLDLPLSHNPLCALRAKCERLGSGSQGS